MIEKKLKILKPEEYRFIEDKDPRGIYDKETREKLYWIIEKLGTRGIKGSYRENKIYKKFCAADFGFLLGENTATDGVIAFDGVLRVDGNFEGEIIGPRVLIVGETGVVTAKITAEILICKGTIRGDVEVTAKVEIHSLGTLMGNIKTPSLNIKEGAKFKGKCHMTLNLVENSKTREKRKRFFSLGKKIFKIYSEVPAIDSLPSGRIWKQTNSKH